MLWSAIHYLVSVAVMGASWLWGWGLRKIAPGTIFYFTKFGNLLISSIRFEIWMDKQT